MTYTAEIVLNVKLMQNSQQIHLVQKEKNLSLTFAPTYYNKDASQMLHGTSTCNTILNKLVWSLHYETFN